MSARIILSGLCAEREGVPVVHGVDLEVSGASWFGLIGANGSGKTTLLRAIAGRLPIASGGCRVADEERAGNRAARATHIAFAPPGEKLPEAMRARDVLALIAGSSISPCSGWAACASRSASMLCSINGSAAAQPVCASVSPSRPPLPRASPSSSSTSPSTGSIRWRPSM